MITMKRSAIYTALLTLIVCLYGETVLAACNATLNGRPMTLEECALAIQVYGTVIPGDYLVDGYGNWINITNPMQRGNTYNDAQGGSGGSWGSGEPYGGSWGGGSTGSPSGVYDGSGGCEGGGCVNIIW